MGHAHQRSQYGQEWVLVFLRVPQLLGVLSFHPVLRLSSSLLLLHLPVPTTHAEVMAR